MFIFIPCVVLYCMSVAGVVNIYIVGVHIVHMSVLLPGGKYYKEKLFSAGVAQVSTTVASQATLGRTNIPPSVGLGVSCINMWLLCEILPYFLV